MLSLAIKFSVSTTIMYFACKIAVGYFYQQQAYYDGLLKMIGQ